MITFEEAADRYKEVVRSVAGHMSKDWDQYDRDDFFQVGMLWIGEHLPQLSAAEERASGIAKSYVRSCVRNAMLGYIKRDAFYQDDDGEWKPRHGYPSSPVADDEFSVSDLDYLAGIYGAAQAAPGEHAEAADSDELFFQRCIVMVFEGLDTDSQELIREVFLMGASRTEAASKRGVTVYATSKRLNRLLDEVLQKAVAEFGGQLPFAESRGPGPRLRSESSGYSGRQ